MAKDRFDKTKLSKSVLGLKFMKKSQLRITAEEEANKCKKVLKCERTEEMINAEHKVVPVYSYAQCFKLLNGRVSYGGMNTEIEKLMMGNKSESADPSAMETDVSNIEMLKMSNISQTIANKFTSKKSRNKALKRLQNETN